MRRSTVHEGALQAGEREHGAVPASDLVVQAWRLWKKKEGVELEGTVNAVY